MSLLPTKINRRCHGIDKNLRQGLITGVSDTGNNFSLVATTPADVVDTNKHKVANICENFCKNSQRPKLDTGGPGRGKLIHEKNLYSKISCQTFFKKRKMFLFQRDDAKLTSSYCEKNTFVTKFLYSFP